MRLSLKQLAGVAEARHIGADVDIRGLGHDSRAVKPGDLFVALPGERVDGHEFVAQACRRGAAAALVQAAVEADCPQLVVSDPRLAMGRIAAHWRARLPVRLVGVTGSNGKTTVKEMTAAVLGQAGSTWSTQGNYNNEIGLPLTLAALRPDHRFAVLEMGAARPGDIRYLAEMAQPQVAVVTNAGPAHLETMGNIEGVARTKGEIFTALPDDGVAIINADDRFAAFWRELAGDRRIITFGTDTAADVRGLIDQGQVSIRIGNDSHRFRPALPGHHNLLNALAAMAVNQAFDLPAEPALRALECVTGLPGRLQLKHHAAGWALIDDTYNANPASLYAGLQVLADLGGERWLVLGDMAELGPDSDKLHAEMGQAAADLGVRRLFCVGSASRSSCRAFGDGGQHFQTHAALIEALCRDLHGGVNCLVKGSRSMAMERVVEELLRGKT
ncbi:MAG: UDP-N-acetylmuramoyl-tripeptide--D-alanyl-D-alanine ligase [Wenzhouxiangella sp.]|nr:MAG: UDP-N-acetylmuramoyl-tripeptide--D-alanyl-D-alanine ligase [Wenzhouxiangella sp.]